MTTRRTTTIGPAEYRGFAVIITLPFDLSDAHRAAILGATLDAVDGVLLDRQNTTTGEPA